MLRKNPEVDLFFTKVELWRDELLMLRSIALDCSLVEELKWRQPCYTFQNKNIVIISGLKDHCVLSFFKGALLRDTEGLLEKPGEDTQAGRVIRFTGVEEIVALESTLKAYINEAIDVEKANLKVDFKKEAEPIPEEFKNKLAENPALKSAFYALTPGRQRGYLLYFSAAKQSKIRVSRIEKYTDQILDGKGFNDCTCGLSKRMPNCDGSHKNIR